MRANVRRAIALASLPLALALSAPAATAATAASAASAASTTGWRAVHTVTVRSSDTELLSVAVTAPARAWAVGSAFARNSNAIQPVIESWNGTAWSRVRPPAASLSKIGQPVMVTATASRRVGLWAFTLFGGWLHRGGTGWTAGMVPNNRFVQASLTVGRAVWIFGGTSVVARGNVPYAAFRIGSGAWTRTAVPGKGVFADASAVSGNDIWAVIGKGLFGAGVSTSRTGGLVHWIGGRWRTVAGLPATLRNSSLSSVLARSDRDVWVGGATRNSATGTTETVGHWNGQRWTVIRLHAPATTKLFHVISMASDGAGGIWAVGACTSARCPATRNVFRLWHEARGRWTGPIRPTLAGTRKTVLIGLATAGRSVWAAGLVVAKTGNADGLIALWGATPR